MTEKDIDNFIEKHSDLMDDLAKLEELSKPKELDENERLEKERPKSTESKKGRI